MVIFHGYVSLPEGNHHDMKKNRPPWLKQAKAWTPQVIQRL
jgi:hypothetical protein